MNENAKKIYLDAAEAVERGAEVYSCTAIARTRAETTFPEKRAYADMFCPEEGAGFGYWLDGCTDEPHQWRLTALCFAAAMAAEGDL